MIATHHTTQLKLAMTTLALATTFGVPALAQQACSDDDLVNQGYAQVDQHRLEEALAVFRQAWERCHQPRAQAQVALTEAQLGMWVEAAQHLESALRATGDAWIQQRRPRLEQQRDTVLAHVGRVRIRGNVDGADVRVNGTSIGTLPMTEPVWVLSGDATIEVRAAAHVPQSRRVVIGANGLTQETFTLAPAAAGADTTLSHDAAPSTSAAGTATPPQAGAASDRTAAQGGPFIGLGVGAAVLAAGGLVMGLAAWRVGTGAAESYNNPINACLGTSAIAETSSICADARATAGSMGTLEVTGLVAAGVFGAASAVLFGLGAGGGSRGRNGVSGNVQDHRSRSTGRCVFGPWSAACQYQF